MQKKDKNGKPRWENLQNAADITGIIHQDLENPPEPPPLGQECWLWWQALNEGRQSGMVANPLSWGDIKAFFELRRIQPSIWEISLVRAIDAMFLEMFAE